MSQVALVVEKKKNKKKNTSANAGDLKDEGLIPELEILPGGGNGNPLQHSRLENPMDREARKIPWG